MIAAAVSRILREPPFRLVARAFVAAAPFSPRIKAWWDAAPRPWYLVGVLTAAEQAARLGVSRISVLEFGVGQGGGLLLLQQFAADAARETGIAIDVFGFDTGEGLPDPLPDYRDHPDLWHSGMYQINLDALTRKLDHNTHIIIGNVRDTAPSFSKTHDSPIGFIAIDLDFYSSTKFALSALSCQGRLMLPHVPLYFDDIDFINNHRFAGELLAIDEFNTENTDVKIDRWIGLRTGRPFPESHWLSKMYVAHDLSAISRLAGRER